MYFIKKISSEELRAALKSFFEIADFDEFKLVRGVSIRDGDICFSTLDEKCFYHISRYDGTFSWWSLEKNSTSAMDGLYEAFYETVREGMPFIKLNLPKGKRSVIIDSVAEGHYNKSESEEADLEDRYEIYIAHPDVIDNFKKRMNRHIES